MVHDNLNSRDEWSFQQVPVNLTYFSGWAWILAPGLFVTAVSPSVRTLVCWFVSETRPRPDLLGQTWNPSTPSISSVLGSTVWVLWLINAVLKVLVSSWRQDRTTVYTFKSLKDTGLWVRWCKLLPTSDTRHRGETEKSPASFRTECRSTVHSNGTQLQLGVAE